MRTPEDHLAALRELLPARGSVRLPLMDTPGHRLATPVTAAADSPRFDNSQMDGYALPEAQSYQKVARLPVGPTVPAGQDPDELYPAGLGNLAAPIMTGAKLPRGTGAIVPVEACSPARFLAEGETVEVPATPPGKFIRRAGSDITAGTELLPAGHLLSALDVGLLASQSILEVEVAAPARVMICTGGAEIGTPGKATIPDANAPMLRALCARYGIEVVSTLHTGDDAGQLRGFLHEQVADKQPTAVITSGGISQGKFEVFRQVLEDQPRAWFGHVDQQPGGPQGMALLVDTPVICLPGNPISTLVSFRLFVASLLGHPPAPVTAVLDEAVAGLDDDREQLRRGTHRVVDTRVVASPLPGAGSHLLARAVGATCLIRVPARARLAAGDTVTVYPL